MPVTLTKHVDQLTEAVQKKIDASADRPADQRITPADVVDAFRKAGLSPAQCDQVAAVFAGADRICAPTRAEFKVVAPTLASADVKDYITQNQFPQELVDRLNPGQRHFNSLIDKLPPDVIGDRPAGKQLMPSVDMAAITKAAEVLRSVQWHAEYFDAWLTKVYYHVYGDLSHEQAQIVAAGLASVAAGLQVANKVLAAAGTPYWCLVVVQVIAIFATIMAAMIAAGDKLHNKGARVHLQPQFMITWATAR